METERPTTVIDDDDDDDNMQLFEEENDEPGNPLDEAVEVPAPNKDGTEAKVIKPKRVVKNPLPKLDAIRLMGPRGVGIIQSTFKDVKFKGKGNEKEDLRLLMKKLEHWAHRLFPKFTFDDTLKQIEKLGSKKQVQNMVKRIRLDMYQSDELNDENKENDDTNSDDKAPEVDVFDQLLSTGPYAPEQSSGTVGNEIEVSRTTLPSSQPLTPMSLTEDQRERIARKRLEALERRRKRLLEQETEKEISISENTQNSINFPMDDATGNFGSKKFSLEGKEDKIEDSVVSSTDKMEDSAENNSKMEDIGTENSTDKMEDIGAENNTDKMEDSAENNTDKMEDIGAESITDKMEDIGAENSTDKVEDTGAENSTDKMEDSAENNTDMMEDIGVESITDKMEDIGAENSTDKMEDTGAENNTDKMEDIVAESITDKMEDTGAENSIEKSHLNNQNPMVSLRSTQNDENNDVSESKKVNSNEESNDVEMVTEDVLLGLIN